MNVINEMKLSFQSRSSNEAFARAAISGFLTCIDPAVDELADIKTAVSEAVTNCIVHAYKDSISTVYITAAIYDNNLVTIKIRDKGCGIENIQKAMEPMYTTCNSGERAGLGFAVMQSMMDTVKVTSKLGKGTTVILKKRLNTKG
ncbi:MAG TPA: anti-sigma F factor [Ruminococcaceae bacterium]|nr:anti-sigma F factor [Oscillospiraceae bacterium]